MKKSKEPTVPTPTTPTGLAEVATPDPDQPAHHPYGMSTWPSLCKCGSYCSSPEESKLGAKGTASHASLATGESSGDEDLDAAAKWARTEIGKLFDQYPPEGDAHDEMKVTIGVGSLPPELQILEGIFGWSDLIWKDVDAGFHVADYKTFSRRDTTEHIAQLVGYALAEFPNADRVTMHVLAGGSRKVGSLTFSRDQMLRIAGEVALAIIAGHTLPRHAGDHCTYCGRKSECETYTEWATTDLAPASNTAEVLPLLATDKFILANPVAAARFLVWYAQFDKVCSETKDRIKKAIADGAVVADLEGNVNWIIKTVNGTAKAVTLSEVLKACDGDIPDGWEEKVAISKKDGVTAFGDRVASIFPVPTVERFTKEKL